MTNVHITPTSERPRRLSLRTQLTVLYGGLFVVLVTAVLGVSGLLVRQRTIDRNGASSTGNALFGQHFDVGPLIVAVLVGIVALAVARWIAGRFLRRPAS